MLPTSQACTLVLAIMGVLAPTQSLRAQESDPLRGSVVRVHVTKQMPDPYRPWTKRSPSKISGSGVVIDGRRILTNAHVVSYATEILIESDKVRRKISAQVAGVGHGIDLALLTVEDDSFFDTHSSVRMNETLPSDRETVVIYGYPMGGEALSVTKGVVSRVEYADFYYETLGIRLQVDAAVNPGNSGGPAFVDEEMIGLVFSRIQEAENIGYLIPAEEIRLFLNDLDDGVYDGKPRLQDEFQTLENDALRARLQVSTDMSGVVVARPKRADSDYPLRKWDVITHITHYQIDDLGFVRLDDGRQIRFQALVQRVSEGGKVRLRVWRDAASLTVDVPIGTETDRLIPYLWGHYPSYFIYGPLVFSPATHSFARGLERDKWWASLSYRSSPLLSRRWDDRAFDDEQLVVLTTRPFPHKTSRGYQLELGSAVRSIDGVAVRNLRHLIELLRDAEGPHVIIEFQDEHTESVVFDKEEVITATDRILEDNAIRRQMSEDVRDLWPSR